MPVTVRPWSGFNGQDEKDHPWLFKCDHPECYWVTAHATQERAETVQREHDCPHFTPIRIGSMMPEGLAFIKQVWDEMDQLCDEIFDPGTGEIDRIHAKARLGGMATVITHWMPEALNEPGKISLELKKRWIERGEGKMPNTEGVEYRSYPRSSRETANPVPASVAVTDTQRADIQNALQFKWKPDQICSTFDVTMAQIKLVQESK